MCLLVYATAWTGSPNPDRRIHLNTIKVFYENRWQTYLSDSSFDCLSVEQLFYYTGCEAFRFGLIKYGDPITTKLSPEAATKLELREAKRLKSTFFLTIRSPSADLTVELCTEGQVAHSLSQ
jgi:ribulose kinase